MPVDWTQFESVDEQPKTDWSQFESVDEPATPSPKEVFADIPKPQPWQTQGDQGPYGGYSRVAVDPQHVEEAQLTALPMAIKNAPSAIGKIGAGAMSYLDKALTPQPVIPPPQLTPEEQEWKDAFEQVHKKRVSEGTEKPRTFSEWMQTPAKPFRKNEISPNDSIVQSAGKEIYNQLVSVPEFLETPLGVATIAASAVPGGGTAVKYAFAADMAKNMFQQAPALYRDWDKMTDAERTKALVDFGSSALMFKMLTKGGKNYSEALREKQGQIAPDIIRLTPEGEPIAALPTKPLPTPVGVAAGGVAMATPEPEKPKVANLPFDFQRQEATGRKLAMPEGAAPPDPKLRQIIEEGVKRQDALDLLAGKKTVEQVVQSNLKTAVTPAWNANRSQVNGGHAEAWIAGYNDAIERLHQIVGPVTQRPTPAQSSVIAQAAPILPKAAEAAKAAIAEQPTETKGASDASQVSPSTEIHGDVRPQQEPAKGVPVEESVAGVQPQAQGGIPKTATGEVALTPEQQAVEQAKPTPAPEVKPAVQKVQEQVKKVAATQGQRPAKEVKSELVSRIEDEIDKLPEQKGEVVFGEPKTYNGVKKIRVTPKEGPYNDELTIIQRGDGNWKVVLRGLFSGTGKTPVERTQVVSDDLPLQEAKAYASEQMLSGNPWHKDKPVSEGGTMGKQITVDWKKWPEDEHPTREKPDTVTIDIPGDGTFTIPKTRFALNRMLARAKALDTKPTGPEPFTEDLPSRKEGRQALSEAKQPTPTTEPQPAMAGPGSPAVGQGPDPKPQIQQLAEAMRNAAGQKVPFAQKVKEAFNLGERVSNAKDAVSTALSGLKTVGDVLKAKWEGAKTIDDLLRAKGEFSAELEKRGWTVRQFAKAVEKAIPSKAERAAIAKWVDAGGDDAELIRGESEAPAKYKQAYRDARNLSPDSLVVAQNIRNYFDSRLQEAIDAGVLDQGVEDYIHRIYERDPKQAKAAWAYVQSGLFKTNPALAKKRVFQWDWEAEKAGYKPVQDFLPRVAQYEASLSRAIAARHFIKAATQMKAADGRPIIDIKGVGIPVEDPTGVREGTLIKPQFNPQRNNQPGTPNYRGDYVNKEFPALSKWKWVGEDAGGKPIFVQGDVAIHPDYVGRVGALLEPSRIRYGRYPKTGKFLLGASSTVKQTMLDLSGFHQVQIAVHGLEHRVNPFHLVKDIDFENPDVDGLLKGGLTLGGDYYAANREGLVGSALTRHIPGLGPVMEAYHSWLFQSFIPRMKLTMAQHALERNKARYAGKLTPEQIYYKTAAEANSAFGELNYTMLERSKTAQDISRLILMAPDFLEARGRFALGALEKGGKRFGNEQRTALLLGALTLWTAARVANKLISGQYHDEPENAFSVVINGKAYGLRTVQGDIMHLISDPLNFWMHRLNPVYTRTLMELASHRDEFGRKRTTGEVVWDSVKNAIPISLRSSRERHLWESLLNSFGVTARRFNDTDAAYKLAKTWKEKNGIQERGEFIYDPDKDPLRPLKIALSENDDAGATREIKKLIQSKQSTIPKLNAYFQHYAEMPFAGSRANDVKFQKSLSDDEKATVQSARREKRAIRQLYWKARSQYYGAMQTQP